LVKILGVTAIKWLWQILQWDALWDIWPSASPTYSGLANTQISIIFTKS